MQIRGFTRCRRDRNETHALPSFLMKSLYDFTCELQAVSTKFQHFQINSEARICGNGCLDGLYYESYGVSLSAHLSACQFVNLFTTASSSEVFARHSLHVAREIIHADSTRKKKMRSFTFYRSGTECSRVSE